MVGGTVKQFIDALEDMRNVYKFDDDKTRLSTMENCSMPHRSLTIITTDEKTGVCIKMSKDIEDQGEQSWK